MELGAIMTARQRQHLSRAMKRAWKKRKQQDEPIKPALSRIQKLSRRERQSLAMKKAWRERPWSTRKKVQPTLTLQETTDDHEFPRQDGVYPERFPFREYGDVVREARHIVLDRDAKGRNAYAMFYDGFPHGLSDATFETHRRVTRVLGLEKQLANGIEDKQTLRETMRGDLVDLINYAVFAVLLLDKQAQE